MTIHLTDLKFVRLGVLTARERLQISEVEISKLKRKKRQAGKELGIVVGQVRNYSFFLLASFSVILTLLLLMGFDFHIP